MTLAMAHESTTRRTGRINCPFTPEEDNTLRRLAAEGYSRTQIAAAMGREYHSIRHRADRLEITFPGYAPRSIAPSPRPRCARCTILLSAAPTGDDGLCGWCADD